MTLATALGQTALAPPLPWGFATLGIAQVDSDNSDVSRFNMPADVTIDPSAGTVFVADGYGTYW